MDIGIAAGAASVALGLFTGIQTVGRLGIGFLGLKYSMKSLGIGALILAAIGIIVVLFTKTFAMAVIYSCMIGLGFGGLMVAVMSIIPNYFGNKNYPKIMGLLIPFPTVLGGLAAPVSLLGNTRGGQGRLFRDSLGSLLRPQTSQSPHASTY